MKDFMIMLLTYSAALSMVIYCNNPLSKHYSATGLYYTWLVIVIGLLIPFRPRIDTAVIRTNTATRVILSNEILNISKGLCILSPKRTVLHPVKLFRH